MRTRTFTLLIFILLLCLNAPAQTGFSLENVEIPSRIKGRAERIITHKGYRVSYNSEWKIPNWVAYELTDEEVEKRQTVFGKNERGGCKAGSGILASR